jgi:hypothetical protein
VLNARLGGVSKKSTRLSKVSDDTRIVAVCDILTYDGAQVNDPAAMSPPNQTELFRRAVEQLVGGVQQAEAEIISLARAEAPAVEGSATSAIDCTDLLLQALSWGLKKYGLNLIDGYNFFHSLGLAAIKFPHR